MKPRNKFEKAVLEQSKHLRPITKTQGKWAFRECINQFAYRLPKGLTTCMDCGHSWVINKHRETCICPHCRAKLQVKETYERKLQQKHYFTLLSTCGEFQVLRMFLLVVGMEKGGKAQYHALEIGQYWWNAKGRQAIVAIPRTLGRYVDTFSYYTPMAIRNDNEAYRYATYSQIYPKFKVTDTLRRKGFEDDFHDIAPTILIPVLLSDSRAETLMKAGRMEHLHYFLNNKSTFDACWQSYKVTTRNGYEIEDISLWCDYVDLLRRLNKDIHSPKYVCPENLQEAHDTAQRKLQAERDKQEETERQQKALQAEAYFQELKAPFFGITFTDGVIQVKVLESVQEYLEEGKALHHCVFTNEYYLKKQSLILSARIEDKRIETIEVSLETMKVIQCRGLQNKNIEYHDRIIDLVNANCNLIRQRINRFTPLL
ncbi:PcfJ domain-containing protein [Hoylesella buccalis]|uniref:PcfJ domain-containing protein n=1 Tax=Hoylesella buccalis TaxID=28127 RepID=UPI003995A6A0